MEIDMRVNGVLAKWRFVRNVNNTSQKDCPCGSWLKHWLRFSKQSRPEQCPAFLCENAVEVGAHVQAEDTADESWYIIPLCTNCNNQKGESLIVDAGVALVPANKKKTCEKPKPRLDE